MLILCGLHVMPAISSLFFLPKRTIQPATAGTAVPKQTTIQPVEVDSTEVAGKERVKYSCIHF